MTGRTHAAGLLAVGDELLAGAHPDLNSPYVAQALAEVGWRVRRIATVGDDEDAIAAAIRELATEAELVVVSGGLGPTLDDVTRHGAARAAGRPIVHSGEGWSQITEWYARAGREMPESNRRQALVPEGADVLLNRCGTAPGFRVELRVAAGESTLFVLPGPPRELQPMADEYVLGWVASRVRPDVVHRVRRFHLFDLSESVFADGANQWMERDTNPLLGVTVKGGILSVRMIARGASEAQASALLDARAAQLRERFGAHVFSESTPDLALALGELLLERGITVTTAESCTGGRVAYELTRVPGISALFHEGVVTYSDEAKTERLGVDPALLERCGAVSAEVAEAMARGAAERAGAELAIAVTGIAGPGGGTPDKPVGLVWFGLSWRGAVTSVARRWPDAGRDTIRGWAAKKALALMFEAVRASG